MTQVTLDNEHVSTGLGTDEFFVTPKVVDPYKWRKDVANTSSSNRDSTTGYYDSSNGRVYIGTTTPHGIIAYSETDGVEIWDIDLSAELSSNPSDITTDSTGRVFITSGSEIVALDDTGTVLWTGGVNSYTHTTGYSSPTYSPVVVTTDGIFTGDKLFNPVDGTELRTDTTNPYLVVTFDGSYAYGIEEVAELHHELHKIDVSDSSSFGNTQWERTLKNNNGESERGVRVGIDMDNNGNVAANTSHKYYTSQVVDDASISYIQPNNTLDGEISMSVAREDLFVDSNGGVYAIEDTSPSSGFEGSKMVKFDNLDLGTQEYNQSDVENWLAVGGPDNQVLGDRANSDVFRYDINEPTLQDATYKMKISGEGQITVGGNTVIPSGTVSTVELFVDDGVRIEGSCFISGVKIK